MILLLLLFPNISPIKEPKLKSLFLSLSLCIPITLNECSNIIGEPDEPSLVFISCLNSKLFNISTILPVATSISLLGYCNIITSLLIYCLYPCI